MKILKFTGENCPACKTLDAWLESNGYKPMIHKTYNITSELGMDVAMEFNIMSVPTLLVLNDENEPQESVTGFDKKLLTELFDSLV